MTARVNPLMVVGGVTWSPDSSRIATAGEDGIAQVWDVSAVLNTGAITGENVSSFHHGGALNDPTWSPDGMPVATASLDGTAKVWDASSGEVLFILDHASGVSSASWSPSGETIISTDLGGSAKIWDAATGDELE